MMKMFIIASFIGFLMGVLTHAKRHRHIKIPKINKASINPGFLLDGTFGAVAAIIGVLVTVSDQSELERTILVSILAGYLGEGLINRMAEKNFSKNISHDDQIQEELRKPVEIEKDKKDLIISKK